MRIMIVDDEKYAMKQLCSVVEQGPPSKIFVQPEHERTRKFLKRVLPPPEIEYVI